MKTLIILLAASFLLRGQQPPGEAEKLMQGADCSGCHAVNRQVVGPAYSTIAQRYAGQNDAVEKLASRIRDGGNGMTAHPGLTEPQRRTMVEWILSQKESPAVVQGAGKQYPYTLKDGSTISLDFPLFAEGKPGKVTRSVFHGYQFYNSYCYRCHGTDATGGQLAPDLRRSVSSAFDLKAFMALAMTGKTEKGMPAWAGFLTEDDVIDVYRYVKGRSLELISPGRPPSEQDQ
jgi:cytochrome c